MSNSRRSKRMALLLYLAITAVFFLISYAFSRTHRLYGDGIFWDGRVYAKAIASWSAGGDPYRLSSTDLLFVGPPFFLEGATLLSKLFPGHTGWYLYTAVIMVSTVALPYLLARFYLKSDWLTPVVAIAVFTFQPRMIVERSMTSGNIVLLIYAILLIAGIPGLRRNHWLLFYFVIILAGMIKPALLAFLLLPLLAGRKQIWRSVGTSAFVLGLYAIQKLITPNLYAGFQRAAYQQVIVKEDFGIGIFDQIYRVGGRIHIFHQILIDTGLHFAVVGLLVAALFWYRFKHDAMMVERLWLPVILVTSVLANPRMQDYDTCLAIIPAIFVCVECARHAYARRHGAVILAFTLCLLMVTFTTDYSVGICLLLLAVVPLALLNVSRDSEAQMLHEEPLCPVLGSS